MRLLLAISLLAASTAVRAAVLEIRPNPRPIAVALDVAPPSPELAAALDTAFRLAPGFTMNAAGAPDLRVEVRLARGASRLRAELRALDGRSGDAILREVIEGPDRPRALGFRLADSVLHARIGAPPLFSTRIAAVRRAAGGGREVVLVDVGGADATVVVRDPGHLASPAWEPGARALLFTAWRERPEIWRADLVRGGTRRLVAVGDLATGAAPSPDGRSIAFTASSAGNADVWLARADGSGAARLTRDPGLDALPAWTADGARLLFVSQRGGSRQLYAMRGDGGGVERLSFRGEVELESPTASPRGDRVAFAERARGGRYEVWVADLAVPGLAGAVRLPVEDGCDATEPSFSPGGELVAYTEICRGEPRLVVASADGARILRGAAGLESPAWERR